MRGFLAMAAWVVAILGVLTDNTEVVIIMVGLLILMQLEIIEKKL